MVKHVSAGGLRTWSRKAYSADTFSKALQRMELMGHITRLMTRGSHDDYPVVLHNYPKIDDTGKVVMINVKDTRTWQELQSGRSDEPHDETSEETSEETHDETRRRSCLITWLITSLVLTQLLTYTTRRLRRRKPRPFGACV